MYDELELDTLGDEKTALFLMMSDTDGSCSTCCVKKRMMFTAAGCQCMCAV